MIEKKTIDIYPIVEQLEITKEEIHKLLKKSTQKNLGERENIDFNALEKILKEIGRGLYRAAVDYTGKPDLKFYFWPGYTTLDEKRVLIKGDFAKKSNRESILFTGIGHHKNEEFFDCPSTLYYDAVLADMEKEKYVGPTTHHWKRQQNKQIDIRLKKDNSVLKILLIECANGNTSLESDAEKSFCHIKFNKEDLQDAIESIAPKLSENSDILSISNKNKYIPWPLNKHTRTFKISSRKEKQLEDVQKLVYPIWFAATFSNILNSSVKKRKTENWISDIKNKLVEYDYQPLVDRIEWFLEFEKRNIEKGNGNYKEIFFSHWYSLFFDTKEQKQELGSAMILTDHELPKEYLFFISPWLKHIYGLMRMEDYALRARRNEWRENFSQLNHNSDFYFKYSLWLLRQAQESNSRKNINNAIASVSELRSIIQLSLKFENVRKYLEECDIKKIDLRKKVNEVIGIIEFDVKHNKGELLDFTEADCALIGKTRCFEINPASKTEKESYTINTSEELIDVMLKDVLSNAVKNSFESGKFFPVKINFSCAEGIVKIDVINKMGFPEEAKRILNTGRISPNSEYADSLGLKILSKIFLHTTYGHNVVPVKDGNQFTLIFTKNLSTR